MDVVFPIFARCRLAEEVATVDQISGGRLDFGAGRSAFPIAYAGYGIPYGESRRAWPRHLRPGRQLRGWAGCGGAGPLPGGLGEGRPPGRADAYLSMPVYVAETERQAYEEPRGSTVPYYRGLAERFARSAVAAGTAASEQRAERAGGLAASDYDTMLKERLAYGTPDAVAERLLELRDRLGLTGVLIEPNIGGCTPREQVFHSVELFAEEVAPRLR